MNMTFQLQDSVFGRSLPPSREKDHLRGCRSGKKEETVTKHFARRALLWVWVHCTEIVLLWVPLVLRLTRARAEHRAPKRFCSRRHLTVGSGRKESLVAPITGLKSRSHEQLCFENWNQINAAWLRELGQIRRLTSVCFLIKKKLWADFHIYLLHFASGLSQSWASLFWLVIFGLVLSLKLHQILSLVGFKS